MEIINTLKNLLDERTRAYIYRVLASVGAVVSGLGLVSANEIAFWLGLAAAVFNILPAANTSTKRPELPSTDA